MVLSQRFRFYFVFCGVVVLSTFDLSSTLLQRGAICHLVVAFYLCDDDSNRQNIFDQSKISNYVCQYIE